MKTSIRINIEHSLYLAAFLLAAALRLIDLGRLPLSDAESSLAYQAHLLAQGAAPASLEPQPLYLSFTTLLFFLFGSGNFAARLLPAVGGALLSLAPAGFRHIIGRKPAVILAFLLAIDPGLLAISRQADGFTMTIAASLFGISALLLKKPSAAGICFGLALLGGPQFWKGAVILILAAALYKFVFEVENAGEEAGFSVDRPLIKSVIFWTLGTVLVTGSLFLWLANNLTGITSSLWEYLRGWWGTGGQSVSVFFIALLVYQVFGLVFSITQVFKTVRRPTAVDRFLAVWWITALVLTLIYPSRHVADLGWASVPMLILAARAVSNLLVWKTSEKTVALILSAVVFSLLVFFWLNLLSLTRPLQGNIDQQLRWIGSAAALVLILAAFLLVRWGWPETTSTHGTLWGFTAGLLLLTISAAWNAGGISRAPANQLWRSAPLIAEEDLLLKTLGDISEWNTGTRTGMEVVVVGIPSPSVQWALRNFPEAKFVDVLARQDAPPMVLTPFQPELALSSTYRGQDFFWGVKVAWDLMSAEEWYRWALLKNARIERETIMLWVREDRFPGWSAP